MNNKSKTSYDSLTDPNLIDLADDSKLPVEVSTLLVPPVNFTAYYPALLELDNLLYDEHPKRDGSSLWRYWN
jgi:hypothetical protein